MNKKIICIPVFIAINIFTGITNAEVMDLEDCIRVAIKHNKEVLLSSIDRSDATSEIIKSKSDYYPHFRFSGNYHKHNYKQSKHNMFNIKWGNDRKWSDSTDYSLHMDQYIYYGGLYSKKSIAKLKSHGTNLNSRLTMDNIENDVISIFYDIISLNEIKTVLQEYLKAAKEQANQIKAKLDLGMVLETDFLKAKVDISGYEAELVKNEDQISTKRTELNFIMGRSPEEDFKYGKGFSEKLQVPKLHTAIELMNKHNHTHEFYKNEIEIAKKEYKSSKFVHMPTIRLSASHSRLRQDVNNTAENSTDSRVGIYMDIDLFSGFSKSADIRLRKNALDRAQTQYSKQMLALKKSLKDNYSTLESSSVILNIHKNNLIAAEKDNLLAKQLYKNGKVTIVDVIDANRALLASKSEIVKSENEIVKTKVRIHRLIGETIHE
jgi:outer membrane protein